MSCADLREMEKSVGIVAVLMERTLKYSALTQRLDAYCRNVEIRHLKQDNDKISLELC